MRGGLTTEYTETQRKNLEIRNEGGGFFWSIKVFCHFKVALWIRFFLGKVGVMKGKGGMDFGLKIEFLDKEGGGLLFAIFFVNVLIGEEEGFLGGEKGFEEEVAVFVEGKGAIVTFAV